MDIDKTLAELSAKHEALTATYKDAKANGSRKAYDEARAALVEFRQKYGKVLSALETVSATGKVEV